MKHDLDRFIEETSACWKQVRENLDVDLLGANTEEQLLGLLLATNFHHIFIKRLVDKIKQLDKIPYLTDYLELIYNYHNKQSDVKAPVIIEAEFIIANTKPSEKEATQQALKKMADLLSEARQVYKEKLRVLKATPIPGDDELPTKNEIDVLDTVLSMMIHNQDVIESPIVLTLVQARCPVHGLINGISRLLRDCENINNPDIDPKLRDAIFYKNRNLRNIDLEKNFPTAVDGLWTVTKTKLANMDRDAVHARAIVERLAKIQYLVLTNYQPTLKRMQEEQNEEFQAIGFEGLLLELTSLRENFRSCMGESDHVTLFANQSEMPFNRRISESLILLKRLIRLKDPDLVTEGDKCFAQEKFKEILEDAPILRKYREELESILSKIKPEDKIEMVPKFIRIVYIVQYATLEMKNYLKESQQEAALQAVPGSSHLALTGASEARQLALKP